jgi:cytochrome P450
MYEILKDPQLHRRVIGDRSVIRKVVEETFRFHSPVGTAIRQTARDGTLDGVTIPEGAMVAAVLTAANRDPRRWSDPDSFRVDRGEGAHASASASTDVWGSGWGVGRSRSESNVSSTGCPGFVSTVRSS